MALGGRAKLVRLLEDVELDHDVMKYLEDHRLLPGNVLEMTDIGPDGTMTLTVENKTVALGPALADNLWVMPV
jgi:hypothetical protein